MKFTAPSLFIWTRELQIVMILYLKSSDSFFKKKDNLSSFIALNISWKVLRTTIWCVHFSVVKLQVVHCKYILKNKKEAKENQWKLKSSFTQNICFFYKTQTMYKKFYRVWKLLLETNTRYFIWTYLGNIFLDTNR